jgi:hypothetical protein
MHSGHVIGTPVPGGDFDAATWRSYKRAETMSGHTATEGVGPAAKKYPTANLVPVVRCFWHVKLKGGAGSVSLDQKDRNVVNLRIGGNVSLSEPEKWWLEY